MGHSAIVLTAGAATSATASRYVLHVVPANGGGVDRYVRDICAHRSRDCILHVVQQQCVFEAVAAQRLIAIDQETLADSSVLAAFGRPALLHAHSALLPVRDQVARLSKALSVNYILTLHDIEFAGAFDAVDDDERHARLNFVRRAAQRIVPSAFISTLLSSAVSAETTRQLIENGIDIPPISGEPAVAFDAPGQFQIAVVGALGPHKGLNFLLDVVAALPPEVRVVIIGYADGQIMPGWLQKDRLWVHGVFEQSDLSGVIRRYGARIALFPNRQPESFSYALSDVWCAGLPALGPAAGALGERISQTGAGWVYQADSSAEAVAAMALDCLAGADLGNALTTDLATDLVATYVHNAAATLLSTRDMVEQINRQYETIMTTAHELHTDSEMPPLQALEAVAATHLNGNFFRTELQKLSGDIAFSQRQTASANFSLEALAREYAERGRWIETLEASLSEYRAEILRLEEARKRESAEALENHAKAHEAHTRYAEKLQQDVSETLAVAHRQERTIAIYEHALPMIPPFVRRRLLARAERAERAARDASAARAASSEALK